MAALDWLKQHLLIILTMAGVAMGLILGFSLRLAHLSPDAIDLVSFPGELLMRALKMLILPLIASSLIVGVPSLDLKTSGHMGLRTIVYFVTTSVIAIVLGLSLVLIMHPGASDYKDELKSANMKIPLKTVDAFLDTFRNLLPDNVAQAMFQYSSTVYSMQNVTKRKIQYVPIPDGYTQNTSMAELVNMTNVHGAESGRIEGNKTRLIVVYHEMVKSRGLQLGNGMNVLGIITFAVSFSITLTTMGSRAVLMIEFFEILNELVMKLMIMIMWYSPIGIMFLIAGNIAAMSNVQEAAHRVGWLTACMITGVFVHLFVVLPGIYFAVTRTNPLHIMQSVLHALLTALGTASSCATLPVTFQCTEDKLRLDRRVTRFLLPIGVTVNMNGSALYFIISPIFIAQMNDINLSFGALLSLSVTALFAAVGTAGVPGGGIVTLLMVLASANLPAEDIGLLIGIDWFIDRFVTVANVCGDCYGCAIIAKMSERELSEVDKQPDLSDLLAELKRRNKAQREKEEERERAKHEKEHEEDKQEEKKPDVKALEGPDVAVDTPQTMPSTQPETVVNMTQAAAPSVDTAPVIQTAPAPVAPTNVSIGMDDPSIPYADDPSAPAPPPGMVQQPLPGMQQPEAGLQPQIPQATLAQQPMPGVQQPGIAPALVQQQQPAMQQQPMAGVQQQGMMQQPAPGVPAQVYIQQPVPGAQPQPGMVQQPQQGMVPQQSPPGMLPQQPGMLQQQPQQGMPQQQPQPGMPQQQPQPGMPQQQPHPGMPQQQPQPGMPQQSPPPPQP